MKILFILPEFYPHSGGGISTYYLHYLKALKPHCEKIKVILGSGYLQGKSKFIHDEIEVEYLDKDIYNEYVSKFSKFNLFPEFRNNVAAAWAMYSQSEEGKNFDIVECTDFGLGFIPWAIQRKKPLITRLHGSAGQISINETHNANSMTWDFVKQTELLLLPYSDVLITHSANNQKFWNETLGGDTVVKIDPVFIMPTQTPPSNIEKDDFGLVTARLQRWKGVEQLCKAVEKIEPNKRPKINWVGRDTLFNFKENTSTFMEKKYPGVWNKNIFPIKAASTDNISILQRRAKFGIVPSSWDMFNFTTLEFLAAGTVLVCSDGAGSSDLINNGINGFKYESNNTDALAACIQTVEKMTYSEYHAMTDQGILTITETLSPARLIPLNTSYYKKALDDFGTVQANDYIKNIYTPTDEIHSLDTVLNAQTLKYLFLYLFKRLNKKINIKWKH